MTKRLARQLRRHQGAFAESARLELMTAVNSAPLWQRILFAARVIFKYWK